MASRKSPSSKSDTASIKRAEDTVLKADQDATTSQTAELALIAETTAQLQEKETALNARETALSERESLLADREADLLRREDMFTDPNLSTNVDAVETGEIIRIVSKRPKGHFRSGMHHPKAGHNVFASAFSEAQLQQLRDDEDLEILPVSDEEIV